MWGAAIIHPDVRDVLPWLPEPMVTHAGTDNNDGERKAAKRLLAKLDQDHPHLQCIVTADRLRANAPPSETLQASDLRSLLGVKAGDHTSLCEPVQAAEQAGRVT